jgi:rhodanese-related sulfurtransferase
VYRAGVQDLAEQRAKSDAAPWLLLDVRRPTEFGIAHLPEAWSTCVGCACRSTTHPRVHVRTYVCMWVPMNACLYRCVGWFKRGCVGVSSDVPWATLPARWEEVAARWDALGPGASVVVVCRRGNDSQRAVAWLRARGRAAKDVVGGYVAWARDVDVSFPMY